MNYRLTVIVIILFILSVQIRVMAQEHEAAPFSPHKVAVMIAHTHVPGAGTGTQSSGLIVPSWGLDYEYWIDPHWAIGLHNDMEIATYVVEGHEGKEIERERPVIVSLVGLFKPTHQLILLAGFGRELEKHDSYWVTRFGVEYEFEINHSWELSPSLIYDIKESVYDSWSIGLAVGKRM